MIGHFWRNLSLLMFPIVGWLTLDGLGRSKELSLLNKIKYLDLNIFWTRCCKPLIFQTQIIRSNRIHSLKYLRSTTFSSKDIVIIKSEFVAKTQFLSFEKYVPNHLISFICLKWILKKFSTTLHTQFNYPT